MALTILAQADVQPRCPACQRPLADGPFRAVGVAGTIILPIRCSRKTCRELIHVVCHVAAPRRVATLQETGA